MYESQVLQVKIGATDQSIQNWWLKANFLKDDVQVTEKALKDNSRCVKVLKRGESFIRAKNYTEKRNGKGY